MLSLKLPIHSHCPYKKMTMGRWVAVLDTHLLLSSMWEPFAPPPGYGEIGWAGLLGAVALCLWL